MENEEPVVLSSETTDKWREHLLDDDLVSSRINSSTVYQKRRMPLIRRENWAPSLSPPKRSLQLDLHQEKRLLSRCDNEESYSFKEESNDADVKVKESWHDPEVKVKESWHENRKDAVHRDGCDRGTSPPAPAEDTTERKKKRKQNHPRRSPAKNDASFKGVTLQLRTMMCSDESHLAISAVYHCKKLFRRRLKKWLGRTDILQTACGLPQTCLPTDTMSHSQSTIRNSSSHKQCVSCGTKKTPLWRDTEDGTPLCNACGIRYKKYRMRCSFCWHIPKKDAKLTSNCLHCGLSLTYRTW